MLKPPTTRPRLNGPIHSISWIMSNVMGSAAEAKIGAAYINGREAVPIRTLLFGLGHPQPSTPIQVDNSTADGFANDAIKQKQSRATNMRFYWIRDRTSQGQFLIYWQPGITNLVDYHTNHHSPAHHQLMWPTSLHTSEQLAQCAIVPILQGCVNSRVPTIMGHGFYLHRICPKLLIDSSPIQLESETSVRRPTVKLFGSSPSQIKLQTSVRQPTLKLFGLSSSQLESQASVRRLTLKLFGSSPSHLSLNLRINCWLTSQPSVLRPSQPLTTHVLDVCLLTVTETKMSPIVCTAQNYNSNYVLIKLLTTYFITQWRLAIFLVLSNQCYYIWRYCEHFYVPLICTYLLQWGVAFPLALAADSVMDHHTLILLIYTPTPFPFCFENPFFCVAADTIDLFSLQRTLKSPD